MAPQAGQVDERLPQGGEVVLSNEEELEQALAALTYFSPSYSVAVKSFAVAHQRACQLLRERHCRLSPNEMRALVESWRNG